MTDRGRCGHSSVGAKWARARAFLTHCIAMSRPNGLAAAAAFSRPKSLAAAAAAAANAGKSADDLPLLPPALKGVAVGFVGGVIAIVALTILAPSATRHDEGTGVSHAQSQARSPGKVTASQLGVRR